jgi:hypothetical protein
MADPRRREKDAAPRGANRVPHLPPAGIPRRAWLLVLAVILVLAWTAFLLTMAVWKT